MRLFIALALCASIASAAPVPLSLGGPHKCTSDHPVAVYKINDETWCETFCIPTSLVKIVEQFGDVQNGTCAEHKYSVYDHSLNYPMYGMNITVDMYKSKKVEEAAQFPPPPSSTCCACVKGTDMGSDLWSFKGEGADCNACCENEKGYSSGKAEPESKCSDPSGFPVQTGTCKTAAAAAKPASQTCYHLEDSIDHKCTDACHDGPTKFSTHHISAPGPCPSKYNFVERTSKIQQCLNDRTNIKYCKTAPAGPPITVTITVRGIAVPSPLNATAVNACTGAFEDCRPMAACKGAGGNAIGKCPMTEHGDQFFCCKLPSKTQEESHGACWAAMEKFCPDLKGTGSKECAGCVSHTASCMEDKASRHVQAMYCSKK